MKRTILSLMTIILLVASIPALRTEAKRSGEESIYPQTFIIDEIDEQNDLVYLATFSGFVYIWEGVDDWQVGDIGAAIMYNNNTPDDITDDYIMVLEYSGFIG